MGCLLPKSWTRPVGKNRDLEGCVTVQEDDDLRSGDGACHWDPSILPIRQHQVEEQEEEEKEEEERQSQQNAPEQQQQRRQQQHLADQSFDCVSVAESASEDSAQGATHAASAVGGLRSVASTAVSGPCAHRQQQISAPAADWMESPLSEQQQGATPRLQLDKTFEEALWHLEGLESALQREREEQHISLTGCPPTAILASRSASKASNIAGALPPAQVAKQKESSEQDLACLTQEIFRNLGLRVVANPESHDHGQLLPDSRAQIAQGINAQPLADLDLVTAAVVHSGEEVSMTSPNNYDGTSLDSSLSHISLGKAEEMEGEWTLEELMERYRLATASRDPSSIGSEDL